MWAILVLGVAYVLGYINGYLWAVHRAGLRVSLRRRPKGPPTIE